MITKLQSINYGANALSYCERGGEILTSNRCFGSAQDINSQMKTHELLNDRCKKKTFHIKIRSAPEDKGKLNTNDWITISKLYANKIGFQYNPYAVYIHEEGTDKEHIHIVASRVMDNNLAVSDSYTHYKNLDFSREIERRYKLRELESKVDKAKKNEIFVSTDKRLLRLKESIFKALSMSDNIDDLKFYLKNESNIKTRIGRGISFIDADGIKIKGSAIDRKLSLKGIEKTLSYKGQSQNLEQSILHKANAKNNTINKSEGRSR
ncbi:relaxase/mobilization nuclease domain-containing protein [Polaribacter ponticola]|uniref:MobA/VirD2-like nuclease domain-containing protein n=1 Tax=Polaribacter ponticola TaxID=2978475 RepID=A0ABT5SBH9_9FLAO|nr:hypothetical protein [Polaribacter sp. MSW5]MDD7915477.1 hypothetical protein [Polaribacter sp. MSW5]